MYSLKLGIKSYKPDDPEERARYILEQMKEYLYLETEDQYSVCKYMEYEQAQMIFNSFININSEISYKMLITILLNTSGRIYELYGRNSEYWNEFLKYCHWKMTGRID